MLHILALAALAARAHAQNNDATRSDANRVPNFYYDPADETVEAAVHENSLWYDADVVSIDGKLQYTWLEFTPGNGDRIWTGDPRHGGDRRLITKEFGEYASPTLTPDGHGKTWLSYEALTDGQWDVFAVDVYDLQAMPIRISVGPGADIHHCVAADSKGSLWFAWQGDRDGQFEIAGVRLTTGGEVRQFETLDEPPWLSYSPFGDWHPSIDIDAHNSVHVVWDGFDDKSFNVYIRSYHLGSWQPLQRIVAGTEAFEGRADVAVDGANRVWIAWEEGGKNWGRPFRGINTEGMSDEHGPVHRFRVLHVSVCDADGTEQLRPMVFPMPSLDLARQRLGRKPGIELTGAFYERARLTADAKGRMWIAYRHYYTPWLGVKHRSHVEQGWGVYARCYSHDGWSPLYQMSIGQGDGMQRLELARQQDGIAAVWTTGRTHRDTNQRPRGIVTATIADKTPPASDLQYGPVRRVPEPIAIDVPRKRRDTVTVGGKKYQLFYGDLHRHTDLSLCRVPIDGTIDDAYRYAIEVAGLDFLGITDHSRDIARGDALSQLWWRSRKEVLRHQLGPVGTMSFIPFFAYERSHSNTADHNVISLRNDMLRPHTYPVPVFWKELDADTITIPHQPIRRDTWNYQDEVLRPLVEIYQGCRDNSIESDVHRGLAKGYHLGFISSSDHMSTSASYACVWAEAATRESVFRAMQSRRTFGATANVLLVVRAGDYWMGEIIRAEKMPPITVEVTGTAPIRSIAVIVDGKVIETLSPNKQEVRFERQVDLTAGGYVYFHLVQADGNEAWSSPLWLTQ